MAEGLSWAAILFAIMTVVLMLFIGYAAPPPSELLGTLSLLAGVLAPLLAVAGLLLAKRGGKRAPRLASVALAFACGAFAWPLFLSVLFICPTGLC